MSFILIIASVRRLVYSLESLHPILCLTCHTLPFSSNAQGFLRSNAQSNVIPSFSLSTIFSRRIILEILLGITVIIILGRCPKVFFSFKKEVSPLALCPELAEDVPKMGCHENPSSISFRH